MLFTALHLASVPNNSEEDSEAQEHTGVRWLNRLLLVPPPPPPGRVDASESLVTQNRRCSLQQ